MKTILPPAAALFLLAGSALAQNASFYKEPPLFSKAPDPTKSTYTIERFGPVGMGIELIQPTFTMRIMSIEPGSPSEATGKLKPGQIIESINGAALKDIDPRIQLGNIITTAEAADGVIRLWPYQRITFSDRGKTSEALHIWSGNILMNLVGNQAQRIEVKAIEGSEFLFIETGNFSTRNAVGWQSPWYVFKREGN